MTQRLKSERQERGVITGDNWTLDSLEKTAELELTRGRWVDAVEYLRLAIHELDDLTVDEAFVRAKTERFQTALRERGGIKELKKFQPQLSQVIRAVGRGDAAGANRMLNEAFAELRGK